MTKNAKKHVRNEKPADQSASEKMKELRAETIRTCAQEVDDALLRHGCVAIGIPHFLPDGSGGWKLVVRVEIHPK